MLQQPARLIKTTRHQEQLLLIIIQILLPNDGIVKISFVPEETVNIYDYTSAISNDNFKKYKGFRITSVNMFY